MALRKGKDIPQDAVKLDEVEATEYAWKLVEEWDNKYDVWALRYAPFILGGINGFSGILINRFYRQKLKLGTYGYFASVLPISIMPAILTSLFHRYLVTTDMLLMKSSGCVVCYEVRSAAVQVGLGMMYPMVLAPLSAIMFANRYGTARVPDHDPRSVFNFVRKITRPFTGLLTVILAGQMVASSILTYFELRNDFTLRNKIMQIEAKLIAEKGDSE